MAFAYNSNNYTRSRSNYFTVIFAVLIAILLTTLPIPSVFVWIWPQWILLVMIYFVFTAPERYGIVFGFSLGLITDFLIGNPLGLHALTYTLASYFLLRIQQRIVFFRVFQQFLLVFILVFLDHLIPTIFPHLNVSFLVLEHILLSSIITTCIWLLMIVYFGSHKKLFKV